MALIRLEDVSKTYHLGEIDVPVLRDVSLSVPQGEMAALMGASGSGKTTLLNLLGCLDRPTSGRYFFEEREVSRLSRDELAHLRNSKIGFVFQNFNLLPRTSALENVMMPLSYAEEPLSDAESAKRAREMLDAMGLGDRIEHEPSQLSGGQQQRVAIARALVNRPSLILADEPTGNLDSESSAEIMALFQRLHRERGITILVVTHDPEIARHAGRIIHVRDGRIDDGADDVPGPHEPEAASHPHFGAGAP